MPVKVPRSVMWEGWYWPLYGMVHLKGDWNTIPPFCPNIAERVLGSSCIRIIKSLAAVNQIVTITLEVILYFIYVCKQQQIRTRVGFDSDYV